MVKARYRSAPAAPDVDVAILGGGLAGLSLAVRLADQPQLRVAVIEPRAEYRRDRTWSYWRLFDHPFRDAVAARWDGWEVARTGPQGRQPVVRTAPGIPYETIPADRLYAAAEARLDAAPNVSLRLGCTMTSLRAEVDAVDVETSEGLLRARWVFDSRPPPPSRAGLVQHFLGQEVEVDEPVFDPGRVVLMDFAVPQHPGSARFLYVLPTTDRTALVEDTWLSPPGFEKPDYRAGIRSYLAERYGVARFSVSFEEEGAIPMDPSLQAPTCDPGRVIPIGTAGGVVKPSSGYAFLGIQRMADALAADLAAGRKPRNFQPRSTRLRWMDSVLLRALADAPDRAPHLFHLLFSRCEPESLVRFMNEVGSSADALRVIAAMPKIPLLQAAARLQKLGPG